MREALQVRALWRQVAHRLDEGRAVERYRGDARLTTVFFGGTGEVLRRIVSDRMLPEPS